jgi:hypothetical protein
MAAPRSTVLAFLRRRSAHEIPHLHGTLLEHLVATETLLRVWGADPTLCQAGLCHATYGTDGFAPFLVDPGQRTVLRDVVGADVEKMVYGYASCDRAAVYPQLPGHGPVHFRDRFTGVSAVMDEADLRAFVDLTVANECEVAGLADRCDGSPPPAWLQELVQPMSQRASPGIRGGAGASLNGVDDRR